MRVIVNEIEAVWRIRLACVFDEEVFVEKEGEIEQRKKTK